MHPCRNELLVANAKLMNHLGAAPMSAKVKGERVFEFEALHPLTSLTPNSAPTPNFDSLCQNKGLL
jgi:hypothetical protein